MEGCDFKESSAAQLCCVTDQQSQGTRCLSEARKRCISSTHKNHMKALAWPSWSTQVSSLGEPSGSTWPTITWHQEIPQGDCILSVPNSRYPYVRQLCLCLCILHFININKVGGLMNGLTLNTGTSLFNYLWTQQQNTWQEAGSFQGLRVVNRSCLLPGWNSKQDVREWHLPSGVLPVPFPVVSSMSYTLSHHSNYETQKTEQSHDIIKQVI